MAVSNITNLVMPGKFEPQKDKWENYKEQLSFALEAAGPLQEEQKRALFLSQCGKESFALIISLLSPRKPSVVPFEEIIKVLDKFFIARPNPILETRRFYHRKQKEDECITNYIATLHNISANCDFKDLDRRLVEQLILGVHDNNMRKELLKINLAEMTYETVVQRALNVEALQKGVRSNENLTWNHRDVAHEGSSRSRLDTSCEPMEVNVINSKPCTHCGKQHNSKCKFRFATCYKCNCKGHTKAVCKNEKKINQCCELECKEDNFGVYLSNERMLHTGPYMVEVLIEGIPVVMEVDSGAARTILPYTVYAQHQEMLPKLSTCGTGLVTWTGDQLPLKGQVDVEVQYLDKKASLPLVVSCGTGPALLGRNWFSALGIKLQGVNSMVELDLKEKFAELFNDKIDEYRGPLIHISLKKGQSPVFQQVRSVPFPLREKVKQELDRMVNDGILTPVNYSKWATPLRIVPKADGTLRVCGDYRSTVNTACEADKYPLPTANEAFFQISGSRFFTKLDLKHAYNQLKVDEQTAELLTLNTPLGLMKMNRLAFGVHAAPGIFQRLMSSVLAGIEGVACLLDDVVVSGATIGEHNERLSVVLQRLTELGLKLNKDKCVFAAKNISFLGFEIDENGVHPLKEKVKEISDKPAPTTRKSLKAFLGLYNFYERFIKDKASAMYPLYRLLKVNVKWQWGKIEQDAFDHAKALLTSDLTLVHYSLDKELLLLCDASEYGVGAVLVHKMADGTERPVMMGSKTLQEHERRYAQIDKEALAIIFGLKKFRQYLLGRKFLIVTDHKPLLGIFGRDKPIPELISQRMLRWALTMNTFDYQIKYRPGKELGNADSLSRMPTKNPESSSKQSCEEVLLLESSDIITVNSKEIAKETNIDKSLRKVKNFLLHGWPSKVEKDLEPFFRRKDSLSLSKECVLWANRVVIPTSLRQRILEELHKGHSGMVQTKMLARAYLWYPKLDIDIENMVSSCEACQQNRNNPPISQHRWPTATKPWSRVHIDFMGPFMSKTFLVIVDSYSKWPILEIVPSMSSKTVINVLLRTFADHGLPETLVSDNGSAFMSQEFKDFMLKNHIRHLTGAPYHPATNGLAERTIETIKNKLKKQSEEQSWSERVAQVLFHMRSVPSTVTGKTPAELLNGRKFRTALSLLHPDLDFSLEEEDKGKGDTVKKYSAGDHVLIRMYNVDNKWQRGVVQEQVAPSLYKVQAIDGSLHRRHVDQILRSRPPRVLQEDIYRDVSSDSDSESIVIPPPEEWPEIIGL